MLAEVPPSETGGTITFCTIDAAHFDGDAAVDAHILGSLSTAFVCPVVLSSSGPNGATLRCSSNRSVPYLLKERPRGSGLLDEVPREDAGLCAVAQTVADDADGCDGISSSTTGAPMRECRGSDIEEATGPRVRSDAIVNCVSELRLRSQMARMMHVESD